MSVLVRPLLRSVLASALLLGAAGCGQTGALYLPDQPPKKHTNNPFRQGLAAPSPSTAGAANAPADPASPNPPPPLQMTPVPAPDARDPSAPKLPATAPSAVPPAS